MNETIERINARFPDSEAEAAYQLVAVKLLSLTQVGFANAWSVNCLTQVGKGLQRPGELVSVIKTNHMPLRNEQHDSHQSLSLIYPTKRTTQKPKRRNIPCQKQKPSQAQPPR